MYKMRLYGMRGDITSIDVKAHCLLLREAMDIALGFACDIIGAADVTLRYVTDTEYELILANCVVGKLIIMPSK